MPRGRGAQQTNEEPLPPGAHARDRAGDERDDAAEQRDQVAEQRDDAGDQRDEAGDSRDDAGDQRDHAAEQRDQAAEARDDIAEKSEAAIRARIMEVFDRSALARREAASDRNRSYGGDEFLCAISSIDLPEATIRLGLVDAALAAAPEHGSVSIGLAQLRPEESTEALIARADVALYADRGRKRPPASS